MLQQAPGLAPRSAVRDALHPMQAERGRVQRLAETVRAMGVAPPVQPARSPQASRRSRPAPGDAACAPVPRADPGRSLLPGTVRDLDPGSKRYRLFQISPKGYNSFGQKDCRRGLSTLIDVVVVCTNTGPSSHRPINSYKYLLCNHLESIDQLGASIARLHSGQGCETWQSDHEH